MCESYRKLGSPSIKPVLDLTVFLWTDGSRWGVQCSVPGPKVSFGGSFEDRAVDYGAPYRDCFRQCIRDAFPGSGGIHENEAAAG